jgi:hypothetical protein
MDNVQNCDDHCYSSEMAVPCSWKSSQNILKEDFNFNHMNVWEVHMEGSDKCIQYIVDDNTERTFRPCHQACNEMYEESTSKMTILTISSLFPHV